MKNSGPLKFFPFVRLELDELTEFALGRKGMLYLSFFKMFFFPNDQEHPLWDRDIFRLFHSTFSFLSVEPEAI
jgi:hypothetical protein